LFLFLGSSSRIQIRFGIVAWNDKGLSRKIRSKPCCWKKHQPDGETTTDLLPWPLFCQLGITNQNNTLGTNITSRRHVVFLSSNVCVPRQNNGGPIGMSTYGRQRSWDMTNGSGPFTLGRTNSHCTAQDRIQYEYGPLKNLERLPFLFFFTNNKIDGGTDHSFRVH
jgi:hypothetical protein